MNARIAAAWSWAVDFDDGADTDERLPEGGVAEGEPPPRDPTRAAATITAMASTTAAAATHGQGDRPRCGALGGVGASCPASSGSTTTGGTATGSDGVACITRVPSRSDPTTGVGLIATPR